MMGEFKNSEDTMPVSSHPARIINADKPFRKGLGTVADNAIADFGAGNFHRQHDAAGQAGTLKDPADPDSGEPLDCQDRNLINLWSLFDTAGATIAVAILLYREDGTLGQVQETILSATSTRSPLGIADGLSSDNPYVSEPQFIPTNGYPSYRVRNLGTSVGLADVFAGTL